MAPSIKTQCGHCGSNMSVGQIDQGFEKECALCNHTLPIHPKCATILMLHRSGEMIGGPIHGLPSLVDFKRTKTTMWCIKCRTDCFFCSLNHNAPKQTKKILCVSCKKKWSFILFPKEAGTSRILRHIKPCQLMHPTQLVKEAICSLCKEKGNDEELIVTSLDSKGQNKSSLVNQDNKASKDLSSSTNTNKANYLFKISSTLHHIDQYHND